ncbi:hypothetical protein COU62_01530 [Candidatus Pacearchaeota archaeon CG10_big_fil_rev_8_21_14_0_10_35_219]|nr:hypothetical protein [Candidatus Pacearchaeota archaeon]OIO43405.1 MAG: hypothetical protein AUJ63_00755 [Candidatus Pacearchaeota archaeon CG1_02_35_32]PIO08049.1 MAG: hypothetical protein COU62_01530 [Candidatus Pacearchaeota archaeon CG10_big_fil_rev_8_21_14_0_10_35_219]PIY81561.1 MAG: hypothetical protein COY79_02370 [Candidatus Pacearchaeota archaeon CG_4_10_14_0_8_um_filter_35_169]PIZ78936.1 MAG: hypothetical protein COY00_04755 [Candidatus Pacearchaeota archaeon CG_4_10_14_0_2_um_filt
MQKRDYIILILVVVIVVLFGFLLQSDTLINSNDEQGNYGDFSLPIGSGECGSDNCEACDVNGCYGYEKCSVKTIKTECGESCTQEQKVCYTKSSEINDLYSC